MFIFNRHFNQLAYAFDKDFALSSGCNHVAGDIQSLKQVSVRHIKYIVLIVSELFHPSYFTYVFVYAFLKLSFVKTLAPVSTSTSCLIFRQKSSSSSTRNPCHIMAFTMWQCTLVFDSKVRPARSGVMCWGQSCIPRPGGTGEILTKPLHLPCLVCPEW